MTRVTSACSIIEARILEWREGGGEFTWRAGAKEGAAAATAQDGNDFTSATSKAKVCVNALDA
jgi:hypothetical protein